MVAALLAGVHRLGLPAQAAPPPAASVRTAGRIHVVHGRGAPYLADAAGRYLLLRGVDSNALVQYPADYAEALPLHRADLAEMAALGVNFLRLAVSWSRIAPRPGQIDHSYLRQVTTVLRWAAVEHIAVLVDMHQDRYNRHTWPGNEVDGAPDWATVTDGAPCASLPETSACAQVAEQNFWDDAVVAGRGLQAWYAQALTALALAADHEPALAGIEIMNEPTQGALPPVAFERGELYPFYARMITRLRTAGVRVPLWFEPSLLRDVDDDALVEAARFSADPQLVYAVHIYTDVFSPPFSATDPPAHLRTSYAAAQAEANVFGTPWVDDEFGADASPAWDGWLRAQQRLQDSFLVGSGMWVWKQQPGFYGWGMVRPDAGLRTDTLRAQLLGLPHVDAVPGRLTATTASPTELRATITGPGGRAVFWTGTQVRRGGTTLLRAPLSLVRIDGRPVTATCRPVTFSTAAVTLAGCRLEITLPPGTHRVRLSAG